MKKLSITVLVYLIPAWVIAQGLTLESDWLKAEVGSSGERLGVEVKNITRNAGDGSMVIDLSLPVEDAQRFDAVEVLSGEQETPLPQVKQHVWMEDYEKDSYGLRLYLKRNPRIGFRLRLMDLDADKK